MSVCVRVTLQPMTTFVTCTNCGNRYGVRSRLCARLSMQPGQQLSDSSPDVGQAQCVLGEGELCPSFHALQVEVLLSANATVCNVTAITWGACRSCKL